MGGTSRSRSTQKDVSPLDMPNPSNQTVGAKTARIKIVSDGEEHIDEHANDGLQADAAGDDEG